MAAREQSPYSSAGELSGPRQPPLATVHARQQWADRYRQDCTELWKAWPDAVPIGLPLRCEASDEARYHPETHAVLIRRDRAIVTVLDTIGADADPRLRYAIEQQLDVELPDQEATT